MGYDLVGFSRAGDVFHYRLIIEGSIFTTKPNPFKKKPFRKFQRAELVKFIS